MHFGLSHEQVQLRDVARRFLATLNAGANVWDEIVSQQGWQAIAIPEDAGGFGFGWMELGVVFEELGRRLMPSPLLGVAIATAAGVELERLAQGTIATVLLGDGIRVTDAAGPRLSGELVGINPDAELVLVEAEGRLYQAMPRVEAVPALDASRPLGRFCFEETPATLLEADLTRVKAVAQVLIAAESVGAASACLDMAVDYLKVRKQFGQLIGTFQALQHMAADMLVQLESARSATWYACWALDAGKTDERKTEAGKQDALMAAHSAKAMATDAFFHCAGQNIQMHGGIGFTWEHDAHRYFKRAQGSKAMFGHPREHREAVATQLLGGP